MVRCSNTVIAGWQSWLGSGKEDVRDTILNTSEFLIPGADGRNYGEGACERFKFVLQLNACLSGLDIFVKAQWQI